MMMDEHFKVEIDIDASSPYPEKAIWKGQHQCVSEKSEFKEVLSSEQCSEIIIKHQMIPEHFSVLNFAFVKFNCTGFPHSVVAQITRHRDTAFLVESNRYTGDRFVEVAKGNIPVEQAFYWREEGKHSSRNGFYQRSENQNQRRKEVIIEACELYADEIAAGVPYEDARGILPYDFRQNFTMAGTLEATFHWLDQRSKADSQYEIRCLAELAMDCLDNWVPGLATWYRKNRWGRARLAP